MKFFTSFLISVSGLVLSVSLAACDSTSTTSSSPSSLPGSPSKTSASNSSAGVTMANFSQLKTGMTYAQVVKILGKDGEEMSSNEISGIKTVMYKWDGNGFGANMNAMFQNGKLMSKAQLGLK
jgi:uncharacterized lipoprotein YehR (DUF1307 family)